MMRNLVPLALSLCLALPAAAQEAYPARPVRFVVPFPPGGPLDVPARFIAHKLTQHWSKPVVVENQAGASGSIGANAVARAEPDGHTLLVTVDIPIAMYPAVATFSSAGIATPAHFAAELFKSIAGVELTHVPYKGAAPAMAAALSGEVDMMFGPTTQGAPHARSGKLRALGVTGPRASPILPGVMPFAEQGFAGLVLQNWFGVFAPAKTPAAVADAIGAGWKQVMSDAEVRGKMVAMDLEPVWEGPEQLRQAVATDLKRWRELAQRAGIKSPN